MFGVLRFLVLGSLIGFAVGSQATHEVDHRYKIFGQIQNSDGSPAANANVKLTALGGRPIGEAVTDQAGNYEFSLHVHNEQLGTRFWVSANKMTREGAFTFDPSNKITERIHRIDLPPRD